MGRKLKVAAVQMDAVSVPVPKRLGRATDLITEAVNGGAQLVVLPELFNTGYEFHERNYALAEPIDLVFTRSLPEATHSYKSSIVSNQDSGVKQSV